MKENNGAARVDLHVHTNCSDGVFPPDVVVEKAAEHGLKAIAITDHDTVEGITPAMDAAEEIGFEIIPGVEISAVKDETEIHVLGYFIDWHDSTLLKKLKHLRENRLGRMKEMVRLLAKQGVDVDPAEIEKKVSKGSAGRLHLARVLAEQGITRDVKEAFDVYIGDGKPCCVRHERLDYTDAIKLINRIGGVAVLAHPGTMGKDEYIPDYVKAGLKGIEVLYVKHRPQAKSKYLKLAKEYNLIVTGGSDFHGLKGERGFLGKVKVGYEVVEALRTEAGGR